MNNYEALRLGALHESNLLDTPSNTTLDTLLKTAKKIFNVKIAAISLIDESRQYFKSRIGLDISQTTRDVSFCSHAIEQESPLVVNDASKDPRFSKNPLVLGVPYISFYSGITIKSNTGYKLGAFCIMDDTPRQFSAEDLSKQQKLASLIEIELNNLSEIPESDSISAREISQSVLNILHVFLKTDEPKVTFEFMLQQILTLTDSSFGYFAEIKGEKNNTGDNRYLSMKAISFGQNTHGAGWDADVVKQTEILFEHHSDEGLEFHNINNMLGEPLKTLTPLISNDFKNDARTLPQGHPDIVRYCAIPLMTGNDVIGVIGLANRETDYSLGLINSLTAISLAAALLIQRDRMLQERKAYEQELFDSAHVDELTKLPNRRSLKLFINKITQDPHHKKPFALCFIDLDGFKEVNDTYGHEFGDSILKLVGQRLEKMPGPPSFIARLGGDEFVVIIIDAKATDYELITTVLKSPFTHLNQSISLSASVGVAISPPDGIEMDTLLRHADQAMNLAKKEGKNRFSLFDVEVHNAHQHKIRAAQALLDALDNEEIVPYLQPKFSVIDKSIVGFEVLSRWMHPDKGILSPDSFLTDTQNTNALVLHDDYIFEKSNKILDALRQVNPAFTLNVNISAEYFNSAEFMDRMVLFASQYPEYTRHFVLEIVESTTLGDLDCAVSKLLACRKLGYFTSLDDFGTSYSSLTYFRNLPIDEVKIDRSFINNMINNPLDRSIVKAVIDMSTTFSRSVVAEGVETEAQYELLKQLGCHTAQGYIFAKPMPLEATIEFCKAA